MFRNDWVGVVIQVCAIAHETDQEEEDNPSTALNDVLCLIVLQVQGSRESHLTYL